jgi:predicted RNA-binding protein with PUA-like domain
MNYWLIKSEGSCYSIDDLKKDKKAPWTGVRNFQARNFMRDKMALGDLVLFYHSNGTDAEPTGVYGIAKVASGPYADMTAFNSKDEHYDPKSKKEAPTWILVDMEFIEKFKNPVTLADIKINPKLKGIMVAQTGSRLSIQPVSENHFTYIREVLAKN